MGKIDRIEGVSTITAKGQTTVPKSFRQALGGNRIRWRMEGRRIVVEPLDPAAEEDDPAIGAFLDLLEQDIAHGRNLGAVSPAVMEAMEEALALGPRDDYDQPLDDDGDDAPVL